jgi:hypothetical protein
MPNLPECCSGFTFCKLVKITLPCQNELCAQMPCSLKRSECRKMEKLSVLLCCNADKIKPSAHSKARLKTPCVASMHGTRGILGSIPVSINSSAERASMWRRNPQLRILPTLCKAREKLGNRLQTLYWLRLCHHQDRVLFTEK